MVEFGNAVVSRPVLIAESRVIREYRGELPHLQCNRTFRLNIFLTKDGKERADSKDNGSNQVELNGCFFHMMSMTSSFPQ